MAKTGPASHGGWRRHARICRCGAHDVYGSVPGAPGWKVIPLLADGLKLKATSPRFEPNTNYRGDFLRHVAIHHQQIVEGDITTLLYPEIAQYLLDMGLLRVATAGRNFQDIYGHVLDHFTPTDPRRCYGVHANSLRLAVTGTGEKDAQITLGLIAQYELRNAALLEGDFSYAGISPTPFMADFARVWVDSVESFDTENWNLTVENNIGDAPFGWSAAANAGVRLHAIANKRIVSLELTDLDKDRRFNEAIRDANFITFEALFSHPQGFVCQIILPQLYVPEAAEDGSPDKQATRAPRLEAMVAESGTYAGCDIVWAVDITATTTLADITTEAPPTTAAPVTTTTTLA